MWLCKFFCSCCDRISALFSLNLARPPPSPLASLVLGLMAELIKVKISKVCYFMYLVVTKKADCSLNTANVVLWCYIMLFMIIIIHALIQLTECNQQCRIPHFALPLRPVKWVLNHPLWHPGAPPPATHKMSPGPLEPASPCFTHSWGGMFLSDPQHRQDETYIYLSLSLAFTGKLRL